MVSVFNRVALIFCFVLNVATAQINTTAVVGSNNTDTLINRIDSEASVVVISSAVGAASLAPSVIPQVQKEPSSSLKNGGALKAGAAVEAAADAIAPNPVFEQPVAAIVFTNLTRIGLLVDQTKRLFLDTATAFLRANEISKKYATILVQEPVEEMTLKTILVLNQYKNCTIVFEKAVLVKTDFEKLGPVVVSTDALLKVEIDKAAVILKDVEAVCREVLENASRAARDAASAIAKIQALENSNLAKERERIAQKAAALKAQQEAALAAQKAIQQQTTQSSQSTQQQSTQQQSTKQGNNPRYPKLNENPNILSPPLGTNSLTSSTNTSPSINTDNINTTTQGQKKDLETTLSASTAPLNLVPFIPGTTANSPSDPKPPSPSAANSNNFATIYSKLSGSTIPKALVATLKLTPSTKTVSFELKDSQTVANLGLPSAARFETENRVVAGVERKFVVILVTLTERNGDGSLGMTTMTNDGTSVDIDLKESYVAMNEKDSKGDITFMLESTVKSAAGASDTVSIAGGNPKQADDIKMVLGLSAVGIVFGLGATFLGKRVYEKYQNDKKVVSVLHNVTDLKNFDRGTVSRTASLSCDDYFIPQTLTWNATLAQSAGFQTQPRRRSTLDPPFRGVSVISDQSLDFNNDEEMFLEEKITGDGDIDNINNNRDTGDYISIDSSASCRVSNLSCGESVIGAMPPMPKFLSLTPELLDEKFQDLEKDFADVADS